MNRKMVFYLLGKVIIIEAALLSLPLICSLCYGEKCISSFLITIAICLALGFLLIVAHKPKDKTIFAKEGFVIVAFAWIVLSALGALPFVISGEIPSFIDAFFETVSGFTTTGASILHGPEVEAMSKGLLFWRSFTHWIGGMGVLVFIMAIIPNFTDRSIHIMRAEMPGPIVGKLVPRVKDTAKILYLIYIVLTVLEAIFLLCGGMSLFDSLVHTFGTAGTGGFGIKNDSIASYSPYCQWIITIFMLIFGINFNLFYLILMKKFTTAIKSGELWTYIIIVVTSIGFITANTLSLATNLSDTIRDSAFQVSSFITTTGYTTTDFNAWPDFSKSILLILMFIGGCAGSTAGGIKVARVVMLFKNIKREIRKLIHKRSVNAVHFEGRSVDETTFNGVNTYLAIYFVCIFAVFVLVSFDSLGFEANFTATVSCVNNIGPFFGGMSTFAAYSGFSKIIFSFAMLFGRLEIFPMIIMLSPRTWVKK